MSAAARNGQPEDHRTPAQVRQEYPEDYPGRQDGEPFLTLVIEVFNFDYLGTFPISRYWYGTKTAISINYMVT